jgi:hypothetical protein
MFYELRTWPAKRPPFVEKPMLLVYNICIADLIFPAKAVGLF